MAEEDFGEGLETEEQQVAPEEGGEEDSGRNLF